MTAVLINSATTANGTSSTSQPLAMPASIVAGRLLMTSFIGGSSPTVSGWTQVFAFAGSPLSLACFAKVAAGSDTGTVTTGVASSIAAVTGQYDSWSGSISDIVAATNASNGDPPLDNPGVSKDWLWVAVLGGLMSGGGVISAAPTSYTDFVTAQTGGGVMSATADRGLTASSEDPGTFTHTGTLNFPISGTVAIAPAVPTLPTPSQRHRSALIRSYHY